MKENIHNNSFTRIFLGIRELPCLRRAISASDISGIRMTMCTKGIMWTFLTTGDTTTTFTLRKCYVTAEHNSDRAEATLSHVLPDEGCC